MAESIYFKILYIILSYLLGSVVFGYIIAKILKKDGFGKVDRPGTAGAGRQYGFFAGFSTFVFDCGKGVAVPLIGKAIGFDTLTIIIASLAVLVGHNWPVFFKFRGGGGVATAMGITAVLMPIQFLIILTCAVSIGYIYKRTLRKKHKVSQNVIGALFAVITLPILVYFWPFRLNEPFLLFMLTIGIFIIIVFKGIILHMIYRNVPTAN